MEIEDCCERLPELENYMGHFGIPDEDFLKAKTVFDLIEVALKAVRKALAEMQSPAKKSES
jgi:hypothetical protein